MDVPIVVSSYRRPGRVTTTEIIANAKVCVQKSEYAEYAKYHKKEDLIVHPDSVRGLWATRQWVNETFGSLFSLDDDMGGMYRIYRPPGYPRKSTVSPTKAYDIVQETADAARMAGAYLFGFAPHCNPMIFNCHRPVRFGPYVTGGAFGMLKGSKLFWPKDVLHGGTDDWICLLNAYYHRFAYLDTRFAFATRSRFVNPGGMAEFRVDGSEKKATQYLKKHFGEVVVVKLDKTVGNLGTRKKTPEPRVLRLPYRV